MAKKLTTEEFIEKAKEVHGNIYDYSLVEYINNNTKVKIFCNEHGEFEQLPRTHLFGSGCRNCKFDSYRISLTKLLEQFKEIHGDKYDYSEVNYVSFNHKIKIKCLEHGIFEQTPNCHKKGYGCKKCKNKTLKQNFVIQQFKEIHGDLYDYSKVIYKGKEEKVDISCKKHGIFNQTPHNHKKGKGCPICKESKGEKYIRKWLIKNKIKFETQKTFDECIYKRNLKFDFYLPKYNICIEYNGIQHYQVLNNEFFGGEKKLKETLIRDEIKVEYCKENNIQLLIIRYDDDIFEMLNQILPVLDKKSNNCL
jgi:hypothetical protein